MPGLTQLVQREPSSPDLKSCPGFEGVLETERQGAKTPRRQGRSGKAHTFDAMAKQGDVEVDQQCQRARSWRLRVLALLAFPQPSYSVVRREKLRATERFSPVPFRSGEVLASMRELCDLAIVGVLGRASLMDRLTGWDTLGRGQCPVRGSPSLEPPLDTDDCSVDIFGADASVPFA